MTGGGGGGAVIIRTMVATGRFSPRDAVALQNIADKQAVTCSWWDAWRVARILFKRLRQP